MALPHFPRRRFVRSTRPARREQRGTSRVKTISRLRQTVPDMRLDALTRPSKARKTFGPSQKKLAIGSVISVDSPLRLVGALAASCVVVTHRTERFGIARGGARAA